MMLNPVIRLTNEEIKKMTIKDFEKYQFCVMKFEISEYVYPPNRLKRSITLTDENIDKLEFAPAKGKYYVFQKVMKFNYSGILPNFEDNNNIDNDINMQHYIYINFIDITTTRNEYNENNENNIIWMMNLSTAGIVNFSNEPNSYDILELYIYKYSNIDIEKTLNYRYKFSIDFEKCKIMSCCHHYNIPVDIMNIILAYIDIQKNISRYYLTM